MTIENNLDDVRREIERRVMQAINENQECFVANWIKQNPDVDMKDYVLVHGWKDGHYTFSVELKGYQYDEC